MINQIEDHVAVQVVRNKETVSEGTHITPVQHQPPKKHETEQQIPKAEVKEAVDVLNEQISQVDAQLKFVYHEQLNEYYVTVVNSITDEIIREIPPKKLMDIHAAMREHIGLLVDHKI